MQSMSDSNYLYQPVSVSPSSQPSAFIFLTLTPNTPILCIAIPQHIIIIPIECIGYTELLKTFHNHFS